MIILDTHIWLWWNQDTPQITKQQKEIIDNYRLEGIGISAIPDEFHKDPADRIIVATARIYDCPLMTIDRNILAYPYVKLI